MTWVPRCDDCISWEQEVIDLQTELECVVSYYREEIKNYQELVKKLNKRIQLLLAEREEEDEL